MVEVIRWWHEASDAEVCEGVELQALVGVVDAVGDGSIGGLEFSKDIRYHQMTGYGWIIKQSLSDLAIKLSHAWLQWMLWIEIDWVIRFLISFLVPISLFISATNIAHISGYCVSLPYFEANANSKLTNLTLMAKKKSVWLSMAMSLSVLCDPFTGTIRIVGLLID